MMFLQTQTSKNLVLGNVQSGAMLGIFFLILKIRRMRIKHFIALESTAAASNNDDKLKKEEHWLFTKSKIIELIRYYIRYPAYFAIFSLLFKLGIKQLLKLKRIKKETLDANRLFKQCKFEIGMISLLIGYVTQKYLDIYSWSFALFLLLRSTHGFLRGIIPKRFHPNTIVVWMCIHAFLPHVLGYLNRYVPWNFWKVLQRSLDERQDTWYYIYGNHHHSQIPPCHRLIHLNPNDKSCAKSLFIDSFHRIWVSVSFYAKFFLVANLIANGVTGFVTKLKNNPIKLLGGISRNIIGCTGFFYFGLHFVTRIACLYQWILYRCYKCVNSNEMMKYKVICGNNKWFLYLTTGFFGYFAIKSEIGPRREDYCITTLWKIFEELIRMKCGLESKDNDEYHWLLGNVEFSSILMAINCYLLFYSYCVNPMSIKSLERMIISKFLM